MYSTVRYYSNYTLLWFHLSNLILYSTFLYSRIDKVYLCYRSSSSLKSDVLVILRGRVSYKPPKKKEEESSEN